MFFVDFFPRHSVAPKALTKMSQWTKDGEGERIETWQHSKTFKLLTYLPAVWKKTKWSEKKSVFMFDWTVFCVCTYGYEFGWNKVAASHSVNYNRTTPIPTSCERQTKCDDEFMDEYWCIYKIMLNENKSRSNLCGFTWKKTKISAFFFCWFVLKLFKHFWCSTIST